MKRELTDTNNGEVLSYPGCRHERDRDAPRAQTSATVSTFKHPLELALEALHELDQTAHVTRTQRPIVTQLARYIQVAIRERLIREQVDTARTLDKAVLMPLNGYCHRCQADLLDGLRIGQVQRWLTACPACNASFGE